MNAGEAMEAGRELDEAVCEALGIPGRTLYVARAPGENDASWYTSDSRAEVERLIEANDREPLWTKGSTLGEMVIYPRVSEVIAAAWQVVEHMRERGWSFVVSGNAVARQYGCKFVRAGHMLGRSIFDAESVSGHDAVAVTLPTAICRAALAALSPSTGGKG